VAEALRGTLEGKQQRAIRAAPTRDLEAFRLYTLGRAQWNRRGKEGLERAAEYFRQAIARDSSFARAWAGLADAYALFDYFQVRSIPRDSAYARAKSAALRAIALDSTLAEPHASLNQILRYGYWDWAASEREIRRAIALDPNYATAHQWLGEHLLDLGRLPEAVAEARISVQLDPLARTTQNCLGVALWYSGQIDEAIKVFRVALAGDPSLNPSMFALLELYMMAGRTDDAIALVDARPEFPPLAHAIARSNRDRAAHRAVVAQIPSTPGLSHAVRARLYAMLGEPALAWPELEKAAAERDPYLEQIKVDPSWKSMRNDPRFPALVARMNLPPGP
jgi:tetratricopeptide (TPR) repeat protein